MENQDEKNFWKIIQNIKKIRNMKGFTQQNMADELGITQKHYSKIESGNVDFSLRTFLKIALALDVSPNVLLGLKEENMINHIIHSQNGQDFSFYYATEVKEIKALYERLLKEKEELIKEKEELIKEKEELIKEKERTIEILKKKIDNQ